LRLTLPHAGDDRVVILDHGRVVAAGPLADLLAERHLRIRVTGLDRPAGDLLVAFGPVTESDGYLELHGLDPERIPDVVATLVAAGGRARGRAPGPLGASRAVGATAQAPGAPAEPEAGQRQTAIRWPGDPAISFRSSTCWLTIREAARRGSWSILIGLGRAVAGAGQVATRLSRAGPGGHREPAASPASWR
jgi:hypothetical protein